MTGRGEAPGEGGSDGRKEITWSQKNTDCEALGYREKHDVGCAGVCVLAGLAVKADSFYRLRKGNVGDRPWRSSSRRRCRWWAGGGQNYILWVVKLQENGREIMCNEPAYAFGERHDKA